MAILLIWDIINDFDEEESEWPNNIKAAVLPNKKVLINDDESSYIPEHIKSITAKWSENGSEFRNNIDGSAKLLFNSNEAELKEAGLTYSEDIETDEIPISHFFTAVLNRYDNQAVSSGIFSNEEAKQLLGDGGWFN